MSGPDSGGGADVGRDARTVRRGVAAGLVVGGAAAGAGVLWTLLAGAGGAAGFALAVLGLAAGALVGSGWLLLAAALDIRAGHPIGRRRWLWTVGMCVVAAVLVVMAPAALVAPAR